ncbi:unnamed protein product [Nippostrongylus brasiliensis]|uniref:Uncharacterized protein n=1 Tax=Nippostrongylus brasiliensis TaxID=27835 RepID=A0A0N4XPZ5_NIPBR|nr:unnamed protein product [Nippostrongylus brasiliensis]
MPLVTICPDRSPAPATPDTSAVDLSANRRTSPLSKVPTVIWTLESVIPRLSALPTAAVSVERVSQATESRLVPVSVGLQH